MKKLLAGPADVPLPAGAASASQPMPLSDAQINRVSGGMSEWQAMALYRQSLIGRGIVPSVTGNPDDGPHEVPQPKHNAIQPARMF